MPADPSRELQLFFRNAAYGKKREVARAVRRGADRLRELEQAAAPEGPTGRTKRSVRVTRTRNELTLFVEAGGAETTVPVREGSGVDYDYALANEFGTTRQPAEPWFYPTFRENKDSIERDMQNEIAEILTS